MTFEIKQGNALDVLRSMDAESVQVQICSPPYYGLRSYKTIPQIWDGDEFCEHIWGDALPFSKQDNRTAAQKIEQGASVGSNVNFNETTTTATSGAFCQLCTAWRGELGLEPTFHLYISHLLQIFAEVKRVLKPDGVCFVNLGDSYANDTKWGGVTGGKAVAGLHGEKNGNGRGKRTTGLMPKSLMNIPHRFFIGMTDELQFIQRNNINWWKRACMPSSAKDRWTVDFESIGFFSKGPRYKFNQDLEPLTASSIERLSQPNYENQNGSDRAHGQMKTNGNMKAVGSFEGRNARTTWDISYEPSGDEHYASYPTKLAEKMILAGSDEGDVVLDIFNGTASTGHAAVRNRRRYVGIELNPDYIAISEKRLKEVQVKLF